MRPCIIRTCENERASELGLCKGHGEAWVRHLKHSEGNGKLSDWSRAYAFERFCRDTGNRLASERQLERLAAIRHQKKK